MSDYFSRIRSDLEKHLTIKNWDKTFLKNFSRLLQKDDVSHYQVKKKFVSCRLHISKLYTNNNDNNNLGIKS